MCAEKLDNLIFVTQEPYTISLINAEGDIINKWLLNNAPINWHLDETGNTTPLYFFEKDRENVNYFDRNTNNLHLTLTNTDIYYFSNRENFQLHHIFNIKSNKWVNSFGKIEEAYSDDSKHVYSCETEPPIVGKVSHMWISEKR